ncbi:MAG: ankyrin repeat domain-containing protein [Methylococcaceae bacterium]
MKKSDDEFKAIVNAAWKNDLETIRIMVANGFDLATTNQYGESVLDEAIFNLSVYDDMASYRFDVVKLLLELGANPNQRDADGFGSLTQPVLTMDTKLIKILLDVGARPNDFSGFHGGTLYDWANIDYQIEIWHVNKFPEKPSAELLADSEDAWLNWMDEMAVKYQRRRPDYLFLLREHGARTSAELATKLERKK